MYPISALFQIHVQTPTLDFRTDSQDLLSPAQIVLLAHLFEEVGESRDVGAIDEFN